MPRIVDDEVFFKVNSILKSRSKMILIKKQKRIITSQVKSIVEFVGPVIREAGITLEKTKPF